MARKDQDEYPNGSRSLPGLPTPEPTISPDGSSRESNPRLVIYSPRLRPATHQGLAHTRGETSKAPAIITRKASCSRRLSESCSTLVGAGEGQGRHPVERPQRRLPRISAGTRPCAAG